MNDGNVVDDDIREKIKENSYKILVVDEKFQTGFDQPLLHRLCTRRYSVHSDAVSSKPLKDTMIIDFRNDWEKIQKSFQDYYTEITLEGEVDTQRIYRLKRDVEEWNIFNESEVATITNAMVTKMGPIGYSRANAEMPHMGFIT